MAATQDSGLVTTLPMTVTNIGAPDADFLNWTIRDTALPGALNQPLVDWSDGFESYAVGSNVNGQGGWVSWSGGNADGAIVTDTLAYSGTNSLDVVGPSDITRPYSGYDTGWWIYSIQSYIPSDFDGQSYFILMSGNQSGWAVQVNFDAASGLLVNDGASGGNMSYLTDQWVEISVEIDLVNDVVDFYYGGNLLYSGTWTAEHSGATLNIGMVDLYANGASSVFYDDAALFETIPDPCDMHADLAWVSATPDSGTNAPSTGTTVDIDFDSTGLGIGLYEGTVCVESNDPVTPAWAVPVSMTVTSDPPNMVLNPDSFDNTQAPDTIVSQTLTISNTGMGDLDWDIFEDAGTTFAPLAPAMPAAPVEVIRLSDGSVDCAAYENYAGAEPRAVAEQCSNSTLNPQSFGSPLAPTDIGFAQDIGYISDNFVSFTLNDFPGQTVVGTTTDAYYGMDFDSSATTLYALNDTTGELGTIDLTSGAFTGLVPCASPSGNWTGLSIDPTTDAFYASTGTDLYTIDPATGNSTLVGSFGTSLMIDIAIDTNGAMYGHDIGTDSIYEIDMATGVATLVGLTGYNGNYAQGMDFDNDDGTLYIFLYTGGGTNTYGTVDLATGAVTALATDNPTGEFEGAIQTAGTVPASVCDAPDDIAWLSVSPISGTVTGGLADMVDVVFDSAGMSSGTYTGTLCLNSNDPVMPLAVLPLTMTVSSYDVALSGDDALTGAPGEDVVYTLAITNTGSLTETYTVDVAGVWAATYPVSITLAVGATDTFGVIVSIPAAANHGDFDVAAVTATSDNEPAMSDSADLTTTVVVPPSVTKTGPATAFNGDVISYTIALDFVETLTGTAMMTDTLPAGISYVSGTITSTFGTAWYNAGDNAVYWSYAAAPPIVSAPALASDAPALMPNVGLDAAASDGYLTVAALQATNAVLWEQVADGSGSGIISDYFTNNGLGTYSADDFVLAYPATLESIFVDGFVNTDDLTDAEALNWYIYADASGEPAGYPSDGGGTEIWTFTTTVTDTAVTILTDTVTLDLVAAQGVGLDLAPGTYWLSFFPDIYYSVYDRFNWYKAVTNGSDQAMLYDDGNFGGMPWTELNALLGPGWDNLAFRLEGTIPPAEVMITFDAEVTAMTGDVVTNTADLDYNGTMYAGDTSFTTLGYGVEVSPATAALSGAPGEVVTYTLTVTNTGNVADTYTIAISDTWGATAPANIILNGDETGTFDVVVTVPAGAADGEFDVAAVTVTSVNDALATDNADLTTTAVIAPVYGVDLSGNLAMSGAPGDVLTYTVSITNTGNVYDTYDLTATGNLWVTTFSAPSVSLAAGATGTFDVYVTIPASANDGDMDATNVHATSQADPTATGYTSVDTTADILEYIIYLPIISR